MRMPISATRRTCPWTWSAFGECLDSRRYQDEVQADFDFAARLGVRSTPTFFINGLPLVGAQPFEVFQQVIDKELAGEIP